MYVFGGGILEKLHPYASGAEQYSLPYDYHILTYAVFSVVLFGSNGERMPWMITTVGDTSTGYKISGWLICKQYSVQAKYIRVYSSYQRARWIASKGTLCITKIAMPAMKFLGRKEQENKEEAGQKQRTNHARRDSRERFKLFSFSSSCQRVLPTAILPSTSYIVVDPAKLHQAKSLMVRA